ncbi:MAG: FtsX-like permease family protein [Bacteroidaceae bacterium]|nr:FtsX-like permease family protein [Bacteroidaceae bacterium]
MFIHYLSLAWDQLKKYRLQSVVSIVSLAIGFACFALASMWIKYETTYDAFHKDADRLYAFMYEKSATVGHAFNPDILHQYPQLEQLSVIIDAHTDSINGIGRTPYSYWESEWRMADSNFVSLVGLELIEGTTSFVHNPHEIAISDVMAKRLWGEESPMGKELVTVDGKFKQSRTISAVFRSWGQHSNYKFGFLSRMPSDYPEKYRNMYIFTHLSPKVNVDELNMQLGEIRIPPLFEPERKLSVKPVTKLRHFTYQYENYARTKINHIYLFALAGCLLIMCGLLNYLIMFVNRLFIRKREMALRTVFGASKWDLMIQFLVEYGLLLAIAMCFGLLTVNLTAEWFLTMTELPRDLNYVHREAFIFLLLVSTISLIVSIPVIWYFRRLSLQSSIVGVGALIRYNLFRRFSVASQITISIFCIFFTSVFMKQLYTLRHTHIGYERENRMEWSDAMRYSEYSWDEYKTELFHFLKQCPELDTVFTTDFTLDNSSYHIFYPKDHPDIKEQLKCNICYLNEAIVDFYGIRLKEGRWLNDSENSFKVYSNQTLNILVNEAFLRKMNWKEGIGKQVGRYYIVGIVKDVLNHLPTTPTEPTIYMYYDYDTNQSSMLMKYKPGQKEAFMKKVGDYLQNIDYPATITSFRDLEEKYDKLIQSELNLQKLLNIITTVCILIALFGVWSMIMLTCEQRRKEIAIRKVYGATTKDILDMFFIEYMSLQGIAAIVAFPIGYACMKPWLEQYVVQTEISWWIYVGIFLMVALLVALCVGWRVWKTAKAKPADEIE